MHDKERTAFYLLYNNRYIDLSNLNEYFEAKTTDELFDTIIDYIVDDFDYILKNDEYRKMVYTVISEVFNKDNNDYMYMFKSILIRLEKSCKLFLKPYNKKEKAKDEDYVRCLKFKERIESDLTKVENHLSEELVEKDTFKVLQEIIFDLKNPDYLFRIIQLKPDFVNLLNNDGVSLFKYISDYYLDNIYTLSKEDSKYFKRIIMLLLESDNLHLKNDDLNEIIERCKILNSIKKDSGIDFIKESLERHFPNLVGSTKVNCLSFTSINSPHDIVKKDSGERKDLRDLFTITIDGVRNRKLDNVLFDDAFSLTGKGNDLHVLISVPDVDLIIDSNSEIDNYMRSLSRSVYQREYKRALLEYKIAETISLVSGQDRNALTFDISMDSEGNIKGIDFYESVIKVNYNFTKDQADEYMKYHDFDNRLNVLNKMYDLAAKSCRKRKAIIGGRSPAKLIMEEFNILPNIETARYFENNNIIFPYKNYFGELKSNSRKNIKKVNDFLKRNNLNVESSELLNSIIGIYNRVFYDTINYGNKVYKGAPCGSVGNPFREYMSLETCRLIKYLIIHKGNQSDWIERIERDCIEYTETSAKIEELYYKQRGR